MKTQLSNRKCYFRNLAKWCSVFTLILTGTNLFAQGGVAPKVLFDPASPGAKEQISIKGGSEQQVTAKVVKKGIDVNIKPGPQQWPSIIIKPESSGPWDLALYGHIEAKITNTGKNKVNLNLRVDNAGPHKDAPWNCEGKKIDPGQTKTILVYFGHSYGFRKGYNLKPEQVTQILFFTNKTDNEYSFRISDIKGAGWVGEKVGVDPDRFGKKPVKGIMLGKKVSFDLKKQTFAKGGAQAVAGADGKSFQIIFPGGNGGAVTFKPATGLWNLNEYVAIKVKLKNIGSSPISPALTLESDAGPSDPVTISAPIAPGAEAEIVVPFAAKVPWTVQQDPEQSNIKKKGHWGRQPGTGTLYRSNVTTGVTFSDDSKQGKLLVTDIVAYLPPQQLPSWLGKKPPVDGDWTMTLNENFDGDKINPTIWNVHYFNWWDKRQHFSKDQVIVKDGKLILRTEKKTGFHNDDPKEKKTDYAVGWADTYGKWTQRYGYFEIREKQPKAKNMWPGLWMMPDRGLKHFPEGLPKVNWQEFKKRGSNTGQGMEFDITESQSAWGIHRFNIACHWDGYTDGHKTVGTSNNYVQADKDGYIVVGMLWLPGKLVFYGNGKEILRWESPRVSNVQQFMMLQHQLGGWDNEPLDDSELPADFDVDYIRVWQRKDLASPDDGSKPNKGQLDAFNETPLKK